MKYFRITKMVFLRSLSGLIGVVSVVHAYGSTEFQYFGNEIDYWNEKKPREIKPEKAPVPMPSSVVVPEAPKSSERFSWSTYLDPKNREFFKEGDYTPPEPFMEIVRNPNDANLKMWFSYIEKKNQLSDRLQTRMREYLEKSGAKLDDTGRAYVQTRATALPKFAEDTQRFRFRMYFDSQCPHCKRMFDTLLELQRRGYFVEARQLDRNARGLEKLPLPVEFAAPGEVQQKQIQSVPLLLVGDLQKKAVYRMTGYQSVSSVMQAIAQGASMK